MTITMPSRLFHVLVILYLAAAFLFGLIIAGYKQSGMTMANVTTCPYCGMCYEESSEEEANSPHRMCPACYRFTPDQPAVWQRATAMSRETLNESGEN